MARPDKASNGTGAASNAVPVARSCCTIVIEGNACGAGADRRHGDECQWDRDTARVLHISTNTVMTELKKRQRTSTRYTMPYCRP